MALPEESALADSELPPAQRSTGGPPEVESNGNVARISQFVASQLASGNWLSEDIQYLTESRSVFQVHVNLPNATGDAKISFLRFMQLYADNFSSQVVQLELASRRPGDTRGQLTPNLVEDAHKQINARGWRDRKSQLAVQLGAMISLAASGVSGSYLDAGWQIALFTALATTALISNCYLLIKRFT